MSFGKVAVVVIGMLMALWVVVQGLTGGWNAISETFQFVGVGVLVLSFFRPRFGFWLLILSMGYLDFLKRLLVMGGITTLFDVTKILALSPLLVAVMFLGLVTHHLLTGQFTKERLHLVILIAVLIAFAAIAVLGGGFGGGMLGKLASLANYGGYVPLLYVVPSLYQTEAKVLRMIKALVLMFLPVALYTFKQFFFGYTWWEIAYLETGLSTEQRILEGQDFRYFSTLNSSQNLSKVAAMVGALGMVTTWSKRNPFINWGIRIALGLLFFWAALLSGARSGLLMGLVAIGVFICFRYRTLTIAGYAGGFAAFLVLVITADSIIENKLLNKWTTSLQRNITWVDDSRRLNIATFTIRLEGFSNLKNPAFWQPFGVSENQRHKYALHDAFTRLLIRVGYIPMALLFFGGVFVLWKTHRSIFNVTAGRQLKLYGLAIVLCIMVGGLSAAQNLSTFPINGFLYIFGGIIVVGFQEQRRSAARVREEVKESSGMVFNEPLRSH